MKLLHKMSALVSPAVPKPRTVSDDINPLAPSIHISEEETVKLRAKIAEYFWFHTIDLGNGIIISGNKSADIMKFEANQFFSKVDLTGKSLIDIGAWNGGFSLEAKRRGAQTVTALDSFVWNHPHLKGFETFSLMAEATNTQYEILNMELDVPGLSLQHIGQYDVVLYAGVFYHMVDPIAVTREVAALAKEVLILETHIEWTKEKRPMMVFYPGSELNNDPTNWWGPNVSCILALLKRFGFPRVEVTPGAVPSRCIFHAYRN